MVPGLRALGLIGSPELGEDLALCRSGEEEIEGRRTGKQGVVRYTQVGPQRSCGPGFLNHALNPLSFQLFPGRGRGGTAWQFWGPCVRRLIWQKRLETAAPTAGKLQASPSPAQAGDSLPVDEAGNP